jgi:uncharacterized membrane protein
MVVSPRDRQPTGTDRGTTDVTRALVLPGVAGLVLMAAVSAAAWHRVPSRIAVHFGADGAADGYAGKAFGLLAVPVVLVVVTAVVLLLCQVEPRRGNLRDSARPLARVWAAAVALLVIVHLFIVVNALDDAPSGMAVLGVALGLLLVVVGNFLPKARRNHVFGVRTPWTLGSELSWYRTHRLAGPLFMVAGAVVVVAAVAGFDGTLLLAVALVAVLAVGLAAYSWSVWRDDPDRSRG